MTTGSVLKADEEICGLEKKVIPLRSTLMTPVHSKRLWGTNQVSVTRLKEVEMRITRLKKEQEEFRSAQYEERVLGARLLMMASCETFMESSMGGPKCWMLELRMEGPRWGFFIIWKQGSQYVEVEMEVSRPLRVSRFRKDELVMEFLRILIRMLTSAGRWVLISVIVFLQMCAIIIAVLPSGHGQREVERVEELNWTWGSLFQQRSMFLYWINEHQKKKRHVYWIGSHPDGSTDRWQKQQNVALLGWWYGILWILMSVQHNVWQLTSNQESDD